MFSVVQESPVTPTYLCRHVHVQLAHLYIWFVHTSIYAVLVGLKYL